MAWGARGTAREPDANPGGVGRHTPIADPPTKGGGAGVKPSVLRYAQIAVRDRYTVPRPTRSKVKSPSPSQVSSQKARPPMRSDIISRHG
jgi:hypothetical protein